MTQSFKFGVASWMGQGNHWLSWIHLEDMVSGILHCMDTDSISGPVNMTSPHAISHKSFSHAVSVKKRCFAEMGIPARLMRLLLGEMADELLLTGQNVIPTVLNDTGFAFTYPTLEAAIAALET
jgi:NAD dependent epimerase/dehydratase family enzyme